MAGRMGFENTTALNLKVVKIIAEKILLWLKELFRAQLIQLLLSTKISLTKMKLEVYKQDVLNLARQ